MSKSSGIYVLFFCSGMASLICEVVWFKQLQLLLGSSTNAVSIVVACFFGGLAIGSWWGGRLADRQQRPLRFYAFLELSLALLSAVVTLVLASWTVWGEYLAPWLAPESPWANVLTAALSLLILLPPTVLMGATLPVLARYLILQQAQLAQRLGVLYGLNTLGAAFGCALVGFVLIGLLGVLQSALVASGIYVAIAAGAWGLSRLSENGKADDAAPESETSTAPVERLSPATRALVACFALNGFASIAYEVLWFRLLRCFSVPTVYVFAGMLSVYLLGLVLGTLICARWLAPHKDRLLSNFALTQLGTSVSAMLSLVLLGKARTILDFLTDLMDRSGLTQANFDLLGLLPFLGLSLLVLLLPTTILGIGFPLVAELSVQRLTRVGSRVGTLYSLNTLGGVLGSVVAGFVLLPLLGSYWSFVTIVALNGLLFLLLVFTQPGLGQDRSMLRIAGLTVACLLVGFVMAGPSYLQKAQTAFTGAEVLAFRESSDATFVVVEYKREDAGRFQQLIVNGTSYANNLPMGRRYMSTLGHLPALVHPQPRSAVVIAIGTGTTVGSLTLHPSIEDLYAVDIAPDVFNFAPHFEPLNHEFTKSPKLRKVVADGRHFLLCTSQRFDVMTFEPPPPQEVGVVNLYSQEFYRLAKSRLAPGGILCQWMPLDLSHEVLGRMMLRTLQAEFPYVSLWMPTDFEGVAIASREPLRIDVEQLRRRMAEPALRADLAAYGLEQPEQLLSTFITADAGLAEYTGDVPLITDNRPRTEYFLFSPRAPVRFADILPHRRPVRDYLVRPEVDAAILERNCRMMDHLWAGCEMERDERWDEARKQFEQARELEPKNAYVRYRLEFRVAEDAKTAKAQVGGK